MLVSLSVCHKKCYSLPSSLSPASKLDHGDLLLQKSNLPGLAYLLGLLILKVSITSAADDIHKYFSLFFRENKT